MAKKKKTKKTKTKTATKKKKSPARRSRRVDHIDFKCILSRCTPIPRHARIGEVGDRVKLEAKRTDATITFTHGSPFSVAVIRLRDGVPVTKTIVNGGRTFEYDLTCSECKRRNAGPPSMIVD